MFILYLKSLEIQGFKSFPTQTRLTFDKPITGIVGPNGSGKSNIADAILWVMGEQSTKTLRGGKMEDVIFGGTQRRPQQNFAEVSLILDNTDGHLNLDTSEVMLTRRYYRSGESEYYINQSLVKLREMTELLMDTGLGREGYSVIGQGKISEILSTKSRDRRDIFEEAAGITRYRHRKDESERKLQQAEENLLRIGDRISELELQYEPLREQAEVAKKYNLLSGEMRGIEISLWLKELETIAARTEKAESDLREAKRSYDATEVEHNDVYKQYEVLSEMTKDSETEAQSVREIISDFEGKSSDTQSTILVLKSRLEGNTGQIENINNELKNSDEQHDGVGTQISQREKRLTEISTGIDEKNKKIEKLSGELKEISGTTGESAKLHSELIKKEQNLQATHSDKKSEFSALASKAQELFDMDESIKKKLAASKEDLKEREAEHKKLNKELDKAQEESSSLENVINGLKIKADNRIKKADESAQNLENLSFELKTLESRKLLLSEMEKDYQGYSKSVKMIMQEHSRGALKNIHGTVGSLIKTDDSYTIAIETAFGASISNIIVDTEDDGKNAINLLKRRDGGRATFLPLSTIKGTSLSESEFKNENGFVGVAIDLVKYDSKYSNIYSSLLGRVVISEDLTTAIATAKKHGHKYKIVTLDGQVINAGGSMTGGSTVSNVGVLSRANELTQLDGRIKKLGDELIVTEKKHAECIREKTAAEYELNTALTELRSAQEDVMKMELEKTHREQNLQVLTIARKAFADEISAIEKRIADNGTESETLKTHLTKLESEMETLKEKIEESIRGHEHLSAERERVNSELAEIRSEIAGLESEKAALIKTVTELTDLRNEMTGSRERQLETIAELSEKNKTICSEIAKMEREALKIDSDIKANKERLTKINERKLEIEAKRTNLDKSNQEKQDELINKERKVSSLELKKQSIESEETLIIDKLWMTYELSPRAAISHGTPIESTTSAKKRLNSIKRELDELGTPYLGAIKEFERVSERYEFYTTQRDDVDKAKTDLLGIIEEITSRMREIFVREFGIIAESFERTFKELFGGGKATLTLEDPEDILNCGIEIEAQPPGKALKTLDPLSGGEKALVAIAIYFAILSVRPPPFVVMDEIDTSLDDANVLRFADYMRFMSNKSQMIAISHKRGTMEEADVLYGITMQEMGVSNILCVDLDEAERHINSKVKS